MLKAVLSWFFNLFVYGTNAQDLKTIVLDSNTSIFRIENFKSKFVRNRGIEIYLPQGYDSSKVYKVLYMQDGQNLFDQVVAYQHEPLLLHECILRNNIHDLIIVGIWNTEKRFREYLPNEIYKSLRRKDKKMIRKEYGGIPEGDLYIRFLFEELKPFIEEHYTVSRRAEDCFIGGISMGGLISCYIALKYPEQFSTALCLSTHWPLSVIHDRERIPDAYLDILKNYLPSSSNSRFYFDYGTDNIDGWYKKYQLRVDQLFNVEKISSINNFSSQEFDGASHAMSDWKKRIDIPIRFLYKIN